MTADLRALRPPACKRPYGSLADGPPFEMGESELSRITEEALFQRLMDAYSRLDVDAFLTALQAMARYDA